MNRACSRCGRRDRFDTIMSGAYGVGILGAAGFGVPGALLGMLLGAVAAWATTRHTHAGGVNDGPPP